MLNQELAALFRELAELTKLEDENPQSFRARAYESAARAVGSLVENAADLAPEELVAQPGIGKSTAAKIGEFVESGQIEKLEELRAAFPADYREMVRIPGIGAKTAAKLRAELGVSSVEALRTALERQELRDLAGLGAKTEEKIARAIERLGMSGKDHRVPIAEVMPQALRLVDELRQIEGVVDAVTCGSTRRLRETIADIDILVSATDPKPVMEAVQSLPAVRELIAAGTTKTSFLNQAGMQVDVRVVEPASFGAAILYFTGSKAHNIKLRQRALERGWTLNEYSLSVADSDEVVAAATEAEIYAALELAFVPAPMREDSGEVEAAAAGPLEDLVGPDMIRGDLHVHTDLSGDGHDSLADMVAAAASRGYEYIAITDHAENLTINGATRQQMLEQREAIRALQDEYQDLRILHGVELNIDPDGHLDYDAAFLAGYDWAVASVHSHFDMDESRQTARILTAMGHPSVNAIGHLTGRMIGRRPGIELDIDAVFEGATATRTALEINSFLDRLDLPAELIRRARDRDVVFVIDTDSHRVSELAQIRWGVQNAIAGWARAGQVANTWPVDEFMEWVTRRRS